MAFSKYAEDIERDYQNRMYFKQEELFSTTPREQEVKLSPTIIKNTNVKKKRV